MALLACMAYAIPAHAYAAQWRTWKHFDGPALGLALAAVTAFSLGSLLVPKSNPAPWVPATSATIRRLFWIAVGASIFGYLAWFGVAFLRGLRAEHIISLATGQNALNDEVKEVYMGTVSGVTTLTQFGMAAVVLACLCASVQGWRGLRWPLAVLLLLAMVRSLLNSERLAVIELVVPGILAAAALWIPTKPFWRRAVAIAPVIGVATLFTFFTASEYLRSWKGFYANEQDSLIEFSAIRLSGYYVTALNNGAYIAKVNPDGYQVPYFTLSFAWKLPVVKAAVREFLTAPDLDSAQGYNDAMAGNTNIEFNNPSGIFLPIVDFGRPIGLLYWMAAGLACGWIHSLYRVRNAAGLCLYPMIGIGLMEAGRVLYWAEPRAFPSFILLGAAAYVLSRNQSHADNRQLWSQLRPAPIPGRSMA